MPGLNGTARSSRTDYTPSEDDNVLVQGVANNPGGLAYFGLAYYEENQSRLHAVSVDNGNGPVAPSQATVRNGSYAPLSRPIFLYVSEAAAKKPEVREFGNYYLAKSVPRIEDVKYVPLPAKAYELAAKHFREGKLGTGFGGVPEVGLKVEELLAREAKL